jgi:hypothetical protein
MKVHFWLVVVSLLLLVMLCGVLVESVAAQTANPGVYLESKDEFANDFSAGVIRKGVPVTLTADTISVRKAGDTSPAQIIERPTAAAPSLQANVLSETQGQPESVAEASRRAKAQKAAAAAQPQR